MTDDPFNPERLEAWKDPLIEEMTSCCAALPECVEVSKLLEQNAKLKEYKEHYEFGEGMMNERIKEIARRLIRYAQYPEPLTRYELVNKDMPYLMDRLREAEAAIDAVIAETKEGCRARMHKVAAICAEYREKFPKEEE